MVRNRRQRRGSNALEFALVTPVLVVLLGGITEWGWFFASEMLLLHSVKEGARRGAAVALADGPGTKAAARVREAAAATMLGSAAASAMTINTSTATSSGVTILTVTAELPYTSLTSLVPTPPKLRGSLSVRLEG